MMIKKTSKDGVKYIFNEEISTINSSRPILVLKEFPRQVTIKKTSLSNKNDP
jgi:hypothetical protein